MKKHIAVCIPSLGTVSIPWAGAFSDIVYPLNTGVAKVFVVNKTVAEARNEAVQTVLDLEKRFTNAHFSHIFWLDDDVICQSGAVVALMQRRKPIVSGVYFTKSSPGEPLIFTQKMNGADPFQPGEFREVWGHGMGLTLVEMDVYRQMLAAGDLGVDEYGMPAWYRAFNGTRKDAAQDGQIFSTEDFFFLDKAHSMGIPAFIDQSKDTFGWHYDGAAQRGYPSRQWEQWRTTRRMTWDTPEGAVEWTDLHV